MDARSAKGMTNRDLLFTRRGACQQQIRDVSAGNQQHQANQRHQDKEWRTELRAQSGWSLSAGRERNAALLQHPREIRAKTRLAVALVISRVHLRRGLGS